MLSAFHNGSASWRSGVLLYCTVFCVCFVQAGQIDEKKAYSGASCLAIPDDFFVNEVWQKVASQDCLKCHKPGGAADEENSEFMLKDPERSLGPARDEILRYNRVAFVQMARSKKGDQSRLLLKATGKLEHGGKEVLKAESTGYRVLADFVGRINSPLPASVLTEAALKDKNAPPFFDGVVMLDDRKLLRRVTLQLVGRLPSDAEMAVIEKDGRKAMPALLDGIMKEEAFYTRLREGFNDVFLTIGVEDNAETILSYEHFSTTRLWPEKHDLTKIADEKERQKARYKLWDDYRKAVLGEPMRLIEYIVKNERPFTEIVTADYTMVSPYTARGYGIYEEVKDKFKNTEDPFEYVPVRLKKLVSRDKNDDQDSKSGFYPHAGLLSSFQYLKRYPTTETNRNRQRARVYFQHFLGVDVLELAARVSDAAAVSAKFEIPTIQAQECVVCHKTIDPIAGLFQDYWKFEGVYGKRKGGWFKDMFGPGYEGDDLPADERWRSLQWLGEHTAKDPRFAVAMVEHVHYVLTGRKVLLPPKDLEDPLFTARRRAYQEQRKQIETIALRFSQNGFNLKNVFKDWIDSEFYRADGVATAMQEKTQHRRAEMDDLGLARMLAPEQVERKIGAIFGKSWGKLNDQQLSLLYGGIDSKEVTERAADPSGAMGAIQRILSNDVACRQTALDFTRPAAERILFRDVEPDTLPGSSPENDAKIRKTIVHLHQRILGRLDAADSEDVQRTYDLFSGIVADAATQKLDAQENYHCRRDLPTPISDPKYTVRAWRAVVTYLLRRPEFLYE